MTEAIGELRRCVDGVWVRLKESGDDYEVLVTDVKSEPVEATDQQKRAAVADMVRALSKARERVWEVYLSLGGDLESFKRGEP